MAHHSIFPHISSGERSFIYAMLGIGVVGSMMAFIAVMRLSEGRTVADYSVVYTYWTIFAGCVGGAGGLWASYERWFGHAGAAGWITALPGALAVSGIGSVVAGTLILPFYGTMFGPFQLIIIMINSPLLGVIWFGMLMCAHGLLQRWRVERDSIFVKGYYTPK